MFFPALIALRHGQRRRPVQFQLWQLAFAGAAIGLITGIVLSTGPLSVPAFAFFGLTKGALLATEAASSLALMFTKAVTFKELGALAASAALAGLSIGASVMTGAFLGKVIVQRLSLHTFDYLIDVLLGCSGISLLWAAFR